MSDVAWYRDPRALVEPAILPTRDMSLVQQMNAVMRLAILFTIIMVLIKRDMRFMFATAFVAGMTMVVLESDRYAKKSRESFERARSNEYDRYTDKLCRQPTLDNPFQNVTINDIREDPTRPPACDSARHSVKARVSKFFDTNLYRDIDDIFHKKASDRQFYSTPVTTIPNDQRGFATWLYDLKGKTNAYGDVFAS
jgi:hypothetical protein